MTVIIEKMAERTIIPSIIVLSFLIKLGARLMILKEAKNTKNE